MPEHDAASEPVGGAVLEAREVVKRFPVHGLGQLGRQVHALEPTTLALHPGRITALVGESGSGKSTLARLLALDHAPTEGEIRLDGRPVRRTFRTKARRSYYRQVQMIFQDPFSSLNPVHRLRYILSRPLKLHGHARGRAELEEQVLDLLQRVELTPAEQFIDKFPHELSGGQRQRVAIARALAARPKVLLGDEPISMLDASIRLDILNLLRRLRDDEGLAILYITHDIASARYFADEIKVLYAGQLVESGPPDVVVEHPRHPYTRLLLDSAPDPDRGGFLDGTSLDGVLDDADPDGEESLGEPPDLVAPPTGCRFHPRCPLARPECLTAFPPRSEAGDGHWVHCWAHEPGTDA